jgi:hypothetical protein
MDPIFKSQAVQWTTNLQNITSCPYHCIPLQSSLVYVNQHKALVASKSHHYDHYQENNQIAAGQYGEQ